MPLTNVYISKHNNTMITQGSTTGNFGTWEDAGISWTNNGTMPLFDYSVPNIFEDGVSGIHTGGLQRAYMLELIPQVPEGVTFPSEGWMSFCTLDLSISGHYGTIKNPNDEWTQTNANMDMYWDGGSDYTHPYNPLWQTEFDPYHGSTPIQDVNGGDIIGPWSTPIYAYESNINCWKGKGIKFWNEATVKTYGDQSVTNPYTSVDMSLWPCSGDDSITPCFFDDTPNQYMHGCAVEDGQDAASLWDPRVSHIVAFNSNLLQYVGGTGIPSLRSSPHNTDLPYSSGRSNTGSMKWFCGNYSNRVYVIVVLKEGVTWNDGNVDLMGSDINIDFDGNAFFLGNDHLIWEVGDPIVDETIVIEDPLGDSDSDSTTTTTTTTGGTSTNTDDNTNTDTGADETFDANDDSTTSTGSSPDGGSSGSSDDNSGGFAGATAGAGLGN